MLEKKVSTIASVGVFVSGTFTLINGIKSLNGDLITNLGCLLLIGCGVISVLFAIALLNIKWDK